MIRCIRSVGDPHYHNYMNLFCFNNSHSPPKIYTLILYTLILSLCIFSRDSDGKLNRDEFINANDYVTDAFKLYAKFEENNVSLFGTNS